MTVREQLAEVDENIIVYDGLDEALIGHGYCWHNQKNIAVYDFDKIAKILIDRDGMSEEEAVEFINFNIIGGISENIPHWW